MRKLKIFSRAIPFHVIALSLFALASASAETVPAIVGAWQFGDGAADGSGVLVFQSNQTYFHAQDDDGSDGPDGIERGQYLWNESTGALTVTQAYDTNGEIGLSDPLGSFSIFVDGDELTISDQAGPTVLTRVSMTSNPIVGGWELGDNSGVLVFLSNGVYFHAEISDGSSSGPTGMERGTYAWNQTTGVLTGSPQVDTNGWLGLSDPIDEFESVEVLDSTELTLSDGGGTYELDRVTNASVLPYWSVEKARGYMQTASATQPTVATAWYLYAEIQTRNPSDVASVTLSGGGISGSLSFEQEYSGEWELELEYATQAELDALFPANANYTITVSGGELGTMTQAINIGPDSYPPAPFLTGSDFSEIASIDSYEDLTLHWNGSTAYGSELVLTSLPDEDGDEYFSTGELVDGETEVSIPAQTLPAGSTVYGYLEYGVSVSEEDGDDGFGVVGYSARYSVLYDFELITLDGEGSWYAGAADLGNGWVWLSWLGSFNVSNDPWIYHDQHGWLYPFASGSESVYFWDEGMASIIWTSDTVYPSVYRFSDSKWLFYDKGSKNPRWFVDLVTGIWEQW